MMEMHIIAYYYHWGKQEILNLTLKEREEWVNLIGEQLTEESEQNQIPY